MMMILVHGAESALLMLIADIGGDNLGVWAFPLQSDSHTDQPSDQLREGF